MNIWLSWILCGDKTQLKYKVERHEILQLLLSSEYTHENVSLQSQPIIWIKTELWLFELLHVVLVRYHLPVIVQVVVKFKLMSCIHLEKSGFKRNANVILSDPDSQRYLLILF